MKRSHRSVLARLDDALRWTGIPARVADDISGDPSLKYRPMRWAPLLLIVFSCVLLSVCLFWPLEISPRAVVGTMTALALSIVPGAWLVHTSGPLGKPASEDDEREAALRKDSFLFCLGLLAVLNCLGQPILLIVSQWQDWPTAYASIVALATLILNATLLGSLPTLYASWNLGHLPKE